MSLKSNKILWGILINIKQWVHLCLDWCIIVNISYVWSGNPCSHLGFIPQQTAHLAVETQSPGDRLWAISMLGIWQPTHKRWKAESGWHQRNHQSLYNWPIHWEGNPSVIDGFPHKGPVHRNCFYVIIMYTVKPLVWGALNLVWWTMLLPTKVCLIFKVWQ